MTSNLTDVMLLISAHFFWEECGDLLPGELQGLFSGEVMSTALGTH